MIIDYGKDVLLCGHGRLRKAISVISMLVCLVLVTFRNYTSLMADNRMVHGEKREAHQSTTTTIESLHNMTAISHSFKVLISQYSSGYQGKYDVLLNLTQHINQLYAKRYGYDYEALRGPPAGLQAAMERANTTHFPPSKATYFKVILLQQTLSRGYHDRLVLLDGDAMMYNFDQDIIKLLPPDKLLAAHRVNEGDEAETTGNINIGVTLWNLRHARAVELTKQWGQACFERMKQGLSDDDQTPLLRILKNEWTQRERDDAIVALSDEFAYGHGTMVKHFIRRNKQDWSGDDLERRKNKIMNTTKAICIKYHLECNNTQFL